MRILFPVSTLAVLSLVTSCVAPPRTAVTPPPIREVVPPPPAAPAMLPADWRDWPQTPGDWRYSRQPGGSVARFTATGTPWFAIRCTGRQVVFERSDGPSAAITIRTSSMTRTIAVSATDATGWTASIAAADPLLDAIGFSRGRFVIEQADAPPLVLPAWAEVERVVEDCRG